jgi:hypothetical protein
VASGAGSQPFDHAVALRQPIDGIKPPLGRPEEKGGPATAEPPFAIRS